MKKEILACELCNYDCMYCFHADECNRYNDITPYNPATTIKEIEIKEVESASMALCEGRHVIPQAVDGSIFENTLDPLNFQEMEVIATEKLKGLKSLELYVTGLTVALVSVLNICHKENISVTLWHYNRDTASYYSQEVV